MTPRKPFHHRTYTIPPILDHQSTVRAVLKSDSDQQKYKSDRKEKEVLKKHPRYPIKLVNILRELGIDPMKEGGLEASFGKLRSLDGSPPEAFSIVAIQFLETRFGIEVVGDPTSVQKRIHFPKEGSKMTAQVKLANSTLLEKCRKYDKELGAKMSLALFEKKDKKLKIPGLGVFQLRDKPIPIPDQIENGFTHCAEVLFKAEYQKKSRRKRK